MTDDDTAYVLDPELDQALRRFYSLCRQIETLVGEPLESISLWDCRAWIALGRPSTIPRHEYTYDPVEALYTCSICGHVDEYTGVVCPGPHMAVAIDRDLEKANEA
jgi:hypothetical protein